MLKNEKKPSLFAQKHSRFKSNENINTNIMSNIIYPISKITKLTDPKALQRIIEEYKQEIINIKQFSKFNEENYEEQIKLIKKQTTNFINENLQLKTSIDKLKMENSYKEKEIDKFKNIIQNYQKLLNSENTNKNVENKNIKENSTINSSYQNELIFISQIEKLKTDNLFILDDLKKEQAEHDNTKKALEHSKESNLLLEKKIKKKNMKIVKLKKQIKELKKNINNNSIQNNDNSIISGSFSNPSKINLNTDNVSNYFSNYSFNSNLNNTSGNENFLKHMNILLGQNNFLRKELQKAKNRIFECNVKMQIYESKEEENLKMRQKMESINDYINDIINKKITLVNYINKQINELNEANNELSIKFDIINLSNSYNNMNNFSLNDITIFFKYIFNKIISLCYQIDMNKVKEKKYIKELKDNEIEREILQSEINEQQSDNEAYKETIKIYENNIKKLNNEKIELIKKINDFKKINKDNK
jgi:chromosome segregation ATPase